MCFRFCLGVSCWEGRSRSCVLYACVWEKGEGFNDTVARKVWCKNVGCASSAGVRGLRYLN